MDATQNMRRLTIRGNWDIGVIEKHLELLLSNITIWGDLDINLEEYKHIKDRVARALGEYPTVSKLKKLIRRYPVVMVTDIITFVLYEFDNNGFWNAWASRYDIDLCTSNQTEIGKMVLSIFERFGFEIIEDGGYAYVTPILCQAGIPNICFDKLFDIFDSTINSSCFNAREFVNELMGYRSYLIDVPVERFFKRHNEKAVELVVQLREMMRSIGDPSGIENSNLPEFPGVPQRIVSKYAQWSAETKKLGKKSRRNTQFYFSPKLVYEEAKGICLYIPEQTLRDDSIYKLRWIISSTDQDNKKTVNSQVFNDDGRNFTQETYIPLSPASRYTVELYDDENGAHPLTSPWNIEVLGNASEFLIFNETGLLLSSNQRYVSRKGTIVVFESCNTKVQSHAINYVNIKLPKAWDKFQAIRVYPADKDAYLLLTTKTGQTRIERKLSFDIELEQTGTLFDEKYNHKENPVYIRFPNIHIIGELPNNSQAIFNNWQIVITHRLSSAKYVVLLSELNLSIEGDHVRVNLAIYAQKHFSIHYGTYELRMYDGKTTRKNFTFYLAPAIRHITHIEDLQSDRILHHKNAVFYVHKKDVAQLEFKAGSGINVLPVASKGSDWVEVSTTNKQAYIHGNIVVNNGQCIPFKKTIRKLEWSFWDERENDVKDIGKTKHFYIEDFRATNWRLILHFTADWEQYDSVKLVLETADSRQLQSKDIHADHYGNCSMILNMFQDTIEQHSLPQKLVLYIQKGYDDYKPVTIALIKSFVQFSNPQYTTIQGQPIILWDKNNNNQLKNKKLELISLNNPTIDPIVKSLEAIKSFKSKDGKIFEGVLLGKPLQAGAYFINAKEQEEFSFFDDEEQTIPAYDSSRIICVNGGQYLENHYAINSNSADAWLAAAVIAQNRNEWISELINRLKEHIEKNDMVFDAEKCSPLLFSLLINLGRKSNLSPAKKQKVKEVCTLVNDYIISNTHRTELLKLLLDSSVLHDDCITIINELQLYLFAPTSSIVFDKASLSRMWDINEKMAILMNLRYCGTTRSADIDRVISRIGSESLEKIISFTRSKTCESNEWFDCFERILGNKCNCKYVTFENSKRVWGDGNEYAKLFVDKRGYWIREAPEEHHTDGYDILGKNYLKLIYELTPEVHDDKIKQYTDLAKGEMYKVEQLAAKYSPHLHNLRSVLQSRLGDGSGIHKLFYQVGRASILSNLASRQVIDPRDVKELLPFWRYTTAVYSELVYRDLIMSELYALLSKGRN